MLTVSHCTATLQHIVAGTLASSRGVSANELLAELSGGSDDLREGGAALDSLDQLAVAREVAEFFELEKTGAEELLLRRKRLVQWSELIIEGQGDGTLTEVWFRSGGTTGKSKLLPQSVKRLTSEIHEISRLVAGIRRIVALVPLHHIYGFIWGPLLASELAVPLIHGPDAIHTAHHGLESGDLVLGVPEWWQYLERGRNRLPEGVKGVTSTAPCPPKRIERLMESGLASMTEVYGSSETGGIGWRDDASTGYQLFAHWHKYDDDHLQSETGDTCSLPDIVDWQSDRLLTPVRRRDDAVQVGGINVWPEQVRLFIESHPKVQACAVRPTGTESGTRLKAYIVPTDQADERVTSELRAWLKASLSAAERPIHLTMGEVLPRDSMGKLCDW